MSLVHVGGSYFIYLLHENKFAVPCLVLLVKNGKNPKVP